MTFGKRLKAIIKSQSISQKELANELHVSEAKVSRWCNDKAFPDCNEIVFLCDAINITPNLLLGYEYVFDYILERKEE